MTMPIILADSRLEDSGSIVAATDTASGYSVANLKDGRPYTYWAGASAALKNINIDCGSAKSADCLAFIGHNFRAAGIAVRVLSSADNVAYTQRLAAFTPSVDTAQLATFTTASARYWRVELAAGSSAPYCAELKLGSRLDFPYPPDAPYAPAIEEPEIERAVSKAGYLLGATLRYTRLTFAPKFSDLTRTFVTASLYPTWYSYLGAQKPVFWAWDLANLPTHIYLVTASDRARWNANYKDNGLVDVALGLEGVRE